MFDGNVNVIPETDPYGHEIVIFPDAEGFLTAYKDISSMLDTLAYTGKSPCSSFIFLSQNIRLVWSMDTRVMYFSTFIWLLATMVMITFDHVDISWTLYLLFRSFNFTLAHSRYL